MPFVFPQGREPRLFFLSLHLVDQAINQSSGGRLAPLRSRHQVEIFIGGWAVSISLEDVPNELSTSSKSCERNNRRLRAHREESRDLGCISAPDEHNPVYLGERRVNGSFPVARLQRRRQRTAQSGSALAKRACSVLLGDALHRRFSALQAL